MRATPIELKEAKGTVDVTRERRRSEVRYDPELNSEITLAPNHLTPDGVALWERSVAQLASVGLNFPSIYEYLESYCRAYETREAAWADLIRDGRYTMEGEKIDDEGNRYGGVKRISQAFKLYKESVEQMILIGAKLGLTPVDKTKISTLIIDSEAKRKDKNSQKRISVTG